MSNLFNLYKLNVSGKSINLWAQRYYANTTPRPITWIQCEDKICTLIPFSTFIAPRPKRKVHLTKYFEGRPPQLIFFRRLTPAEEGEGWVDAQSGRHRGVTSGRMWWILLQSRDMRRLRFGGGRLTEMRTTTPCSWPAASILRFAPRRRSRLELVRDLSLLVTLSLLLGPVFSRTRRLTADVVRWGCSAKIHWFYFHQRFAAPYDFDYYYYLPTFPPSESWEWHYL